MAKTPRPRTNDDIIDEFKTAAWQDEVDIINNLAAKHPWLVDPAKPYLVEALHTACNACQQNSAQLLVEKYKADVNVISPDGLNALHEAMNSHDIVTAKMLIRNGADVNIPTQTTDGFVDGWTPLHFAISSGDTEMILLMLKHGADPKLKEKDGLDAAAFARRDKREDLATIIEKMTAQAPETRIVPKRKTPGPGL
ncbi:MAG: ankyrin repeat domain-containing protein [Alphaproteobacteria bacterium]|nr:MAG: ankyrin repeat domain-containing protein [Alphaproteobacteria bacterium]